MKYVNHHCHSMYSNVITPDVTITNHDRVTRTKELGLSVVSSVEHGYSGNYFEVIQLAKENELKPLFGVETYFVKDRFEKDRTNAHLMLLAKNERGRKEINAALSEANLSGFYYKARMDKDIVSKLNPENVWCTTACLGGIWKYEDSEDILLWLKNIFKDSLFLEVQPHHTQTQIELNTKIIDLAKQHKIQIIAGMDTHMIYPSQAEERDNYLASRGIFYDDEVGWFLDYPDYETAFERFQNQGVLSDVQIEMAMDNTLVFEQVEEYDSIIFDLEKIKLPSIYPNYTQEEKDNALSDLIWEKWGEEKENIPDDKWKLYEKEIKKELKVIFETKMSDYFLLDYEIVKRGKEMGGSITLTGRGSSPSYYITKLIGLTTIDRISASVKLFPERFITKERIIDAGSLPDIDLNLGTPEIFAKAQEEILGKDHSYPMIAFVTLKDLGAWKMYARANSVDFMLANEISDKLKQFEFDKKHAEEDNEVVIDDYLSGKHLEIYRKSKDYLGLVNSLTVHPCAALLFSDGRISEEFGLIKIKTGNVEHICVNCDGYFAEKSHMLKNDLLKVNVVDLIHRVYKRIGIEPHPLPQLLDLCERNTKVWDIYKNEAGIGINQVEQPGTITRVAKYAPQNISELSAFVAAIRPGFKSNYQQFENREPFSYNIASLDDLIQTEEFPQSYMLYQENAMEVMAYAGIPIHKTYEIVKAIAKKRYKDVIKEKNKFISGMKKRLVENEGITDKWAEETAKKTWQIIEDSSRYSFNCSHAYSVAGDSLYGAWLKSNYPLEFYEVFLKMMDEQADKDRMALAKNEARRVFGIEFLPYRFRQDNREIVAIKDKNQITSSLKEIKGFNKKIAEDLYSLRNNKYEDFVDFLIDCEEKGIMSTKFESLIRINYFEEFGKNKKLLDVYLEFKKGKTRYSFKHSDKTKEKRIVALKELWNELPNKSLSIREQIESEINIFGFIQSKFNKPKIVYVLDVDTKFSPKLLVYSLEKGSTGILKINKRTYNEYKLYNNDFPSGRPIQAGDFMKWFDIEKKPAVRYDNGNYIPIDGEYNYWVNDYQIL